MKKALILLSLAALVPLAGCVSPYGYDHYGYYGRGDAYAGYGYRGGYGRDYYEDERADPWANYSAPRDYGYRYYNGYDD